MNAPGRRTWREHRTESGFTLLELMISLSLLGVMLTMAYSVFTTALMAVPRGEDMAARSMRFRAATSILSKQVRSAVNYPAHAENDDVFPYFWGDPASFSFITASPQHRGGEGLGWVTYWTDGRSVSMGERLIFSADSVSGDAPDPTSQTVLLDGLSSARFEYLRLDGDESEWRDGWDAFEEQGLPAAVRITLGGVNDGKTYWVQEIPLMPVAYGLGAYDPEIAVQQQGGAGGGGSGSDGSDGGGQGGDGGDDGGDEP
ncbi:prepilin-type N-terminal cleavage/methylation domain-containing protein [bacterium]|nr:prepilin-type N-terminal cleavage/methylation domain-containing protein [bacterium]